MPRLKYRNVPTVVDGIRFASKKEAKRYGELKLMEKGGEIYDLEGQPVYPLFVSGHKVGKYVGDFRYTRRIDGEVDEIIEDVKGVKTPVYRLKKKLVKAIYGIDITEV
jgi:hypothetical protein